MSNGFDGVEWRLSDCVEHPQPAISHLETIPIRAVAMRCEMMDIPLAVQFLSAQMREVASLGAKVLNLSIPPVRRSNDSVGFTRYQDALNFAYELLQRLRFEAEAAGVNIALEAATGGCFLSPVEVRELIDAVNSSAIGVCLDLERVGAIGSPLDWIDTLHRQIQAVRCTEIPSTPTGASAQTCQVPIDTLIQALDGIHSDCPLILSGSVAKSGAGMAALRLAMPPSNSFADK